MMAHSASERAPKTRWVLARDFEGYLAFSIQPGLPLAESNDPHNAAQ